MSPMASQITSLTIVYSTVYSGADQRKHQSSASLVFVWGIHRWPVNSPQKWPVTQKMFPFDDDIMHGVHMWTSHISVRCEVWDTTIHLISCRLAVELYKRVQLCKRKMFARLLFDMITKNVTMYHGIACLIDVSIPELITHILYRNISM